MATVTSGYAINMPSADSGGGVGTVTSVDSVAPDTSGNVALGAFTANHLQINMPGAPGSSMLAAINLAGNTDGSVYRRIGETVPGSILNPTALLRDTTYATNFLGIQWDTMDADEPVGTWACAGFSVFGLHATLWTRIDTPVPTENLADSQPSIRNCQYAKSDNSLIDCEILNNGIWQPFTASPRDCTDYGPKIYQNAVEGVYGEVLPYSDESPS